jgi:ferritin-like metal-binding protein YciE
MREGTAFGTDVGGTRALPRHETADDQQAKGAAMATISAIAAPRDLFLTELQSMLYVEDKLANEVLPELSEQIKDSDFKADVKHHIEETRRHTANLERALELLGVEPQPDKSHAIDGLVAQHDKIVKHIETDPVRDIFNAGAAAKTEHLEIAAYEGMIETAEALGEDEVVSLLEENLDDEKAALKKVEKATKELTKEASAV